MKKYWLRVENENVLAAGVTAVAFLGYLTTMCPTVSFTDSGELAAVVTTLGIAHPTGYPLFTLLGRCIVMIPAAAEEIVRLNVFAAILTSVAAGLFFKTSLALTRSSSLFGGKGGADNLRGTSRAHIASIIASLVLAFSSTFWSQSAAVEVYALHVVMILMTTFAFIKGMEEQMVTRGETSRYFFLFAFVLGLSFTNHMTTILLAPSFLFLCFLTFGFRRLAFVRLVRISPFFLAGLSVYLYLPIRSSGRPLFDWGHPVTMERLVWHLTGKQYRTWMFTNLDVAKKQLSYYFSNYSLEFNWVVVAIILLGAIATYRRSKRLFAFLLLLALATIFYAVNYDIHDIDSYFLLSYIAAAWFLVFGIDAVFSFVMRQTRWKRYAVMVFLAVLPVLQFVQNKERVDQTQNYLAEDFVRTTLHNVEPNSVIFSSQWDYFVSPSWYYQIVRRERPDVTIIDKSLLQNRSWYFYQLERNHPWLMDRSRGRVTAFLAELSKFEHEKPFNLNIIQARWSELLDGFVRTSLVDHPVYVDVRVESEFAPQYRRVPEASLVRLLNPADSAQYKPSTVIFRSWNQQNLVAKDFRRYFASMLTFHAVWLTKNQKVEEARSTLQRAIDIDPENLAAKSLILDLSQPQR